MLKPVDPELLVKAIEKIKLSQEFPEQQTRKHAALNENRLTGTLNKMALPTQNGIQLVKVDDVVRLEADGNYTTLFMKDKRI